MITLKRPGPTETLTYFAILVILISILFLGISLTGKAISLAGQVNLTIESAATVEFTLDAINFGSGQVTGGNLSATLDSLGTVANGSWTPITEGFKLENTGNINVTLNLKTGKTASEFLGGTNASYKYNVSNSEPNSCLSSQITLGEWYDVNTTHPGTEICGVLPYPETSDEIRIDVKIIIPSDARAGLQSDTFTATATSAI